MKPKKLNEEDDKNAAIKSFQQLMQQWKTLNGSHISRYKQQQTLWSEFKKAGDALYEGRQNQFKTAEKESLDNATQAQSLIDSIKQLAEVIKTKNQDAIGEDLKSLQQAKEQFQSLGALPNNQFKRLTQDFEIACESINDAIQKSHKNSWLQQLQSLADFGQQCSAAEQDNTATADLIPSAFPAYWQSALQARFAPRESHEDYDKQARGLCIAIEKLYGLETPESDSALKMELQMQQLADNFGQQKSVSHNDEIEALYLQWFALPCWDTNQHQQLQQRFLAATQA